MDAERAAQRVFELVDAGRVRQAEGVLEDARQRYASKATTTTTTSDGDSNNGSCGHASLDVATALLLVQQGKLPQARALAELLSARDDVREPRSVDTLVRVLQDVCSWHALARVYERLRATQPQPRKIDENLVQTYVRMGDYAATQRAAMTLMRTYGNDAKYAMWVAQACLAQLTYTTTTTTTTAQNDGSGTTRPPPSAVDAGMRDVLLRLASKMIETVVLCGDAASASSSTTTTTTNATRTVATSPAALRTYVHVLQQQHRYDDVVRLLCSARGAAIGLRAHRLELLATVLQQQHQHAEHMQQTTTTAEAHAATSARARAAANATARLLWTLQPDNWTAFTLYRDTLSRQRRTHDNDDDDARGEEQSLELAAVVDAADDDDADNDGATAAQQLRARVVWRVDGEDDVHDALALARTLQQQQLLQQQKQNEHKKTKLLRGPFLAELALLQQQQQRADDDDSSNSCDRALNDAVLAYAKRFYMTPCCYLDLSTFLTHGASSSSSSSAAEAVYAWSCEADDAAATDATTCSSSSSSTAHVGGDERAQLAYHTRRILGLRCDVASWGCTTATMPSRAVVRARMQTCMQLYAAAAPLSASRAWNEEGLCDGYVSVALNVALRASVACERADEDRRNNNDDDNNNSDNDEDDDSDWRAWLVRALELLHRDTTRTRNNPSWLILGICFAARLGLADAAAVRQLDLKSVQHDTMAPLAYWPLRRGMLLDEVRAHDERAMTQYYAHVERDCALLRAKVFTYVSWPAMHSVRAFEHAQRHSLARVWTRTHVVVNGLLECQTQRSIAAYMASAAPELVAIVQQLHTSVTHGLLVDNTDWRTLQSVVLADAHASTVQQQLTHAMTTTTMTALSAATAVAPTTTAAATMQHATYCRQLLHTLLLVCDVVALEEQRRRDTAAQPKRSKTHNKTTSTTSTTPTLYCAKLAQMYASSDDAIDFTPAFATIATPLLAHVLTRARAQDQRSSHHDSGKCNNNNTNDDGSDHDAVPYTNALAMHLTSLLQHDDGTCDDDATTTTSLRACMCGLAFERFVYPEAYVLAALLRAGMPGVLPLQQWASDLQCALHVAQTRYAEARWCALRLPCVVDGGYVHTLVADKTRRMCRCLADMLVDVKATSSQTRGR